MWNALNQAEGAERWGCRGGRGRGAPGLAGPPRSLQAESLKGWKLGNGPIWLRILKASPAEKEWEGSKPGGPCDSPGESRGGVTEASTRRPHQGVGGHIWAQSARYEIHKRKTPGFSYPVGGGPERDVCASHPRCRHGTSTPGELGNEHSCCLLGRGPHVAPNEAELTALRLYIFF